MKIFLCIIVLKLMFFITSKSYLNTQKPLISLGYYHQNSFNQIKRRIIKEYTSNNSLVMYIAQPKYSIIWLHQLGGTILQYQNYFSLPESPIFHGARFKLLQAPLRYTGIVQEITPSWYNIKSFDIKNQQIFSLQEMKQSSNFIDQHIKGEVQYWKKVIPQSKISPYQRIFIGGMSQGCAFSLKQGLEYQTPLGGIICIAGHMISFTKLKNLYKTKILLIHGTKDELFSQKDIKQQYSELLKSSNTTYKSMKGLNHSINAQVLKETTKWILQTVKDLDKS